MASAQAVIVPPFPLDSSKSADLVWALADAISRHDRALDALLKAITACVWCLRDDEEMTAENVILTMKAVLRHSVSADPARRRGDIATVDFWMEDLVTWCIGEYFRRE